ncbi:caspase-12-like [Sorex fumeus]|uniref:caspase-12-like n=1 Tax=Sorex fumeus TaxID=62283 RepID=UPI0024AD46DB|nr:caspase-12-like [Sorex fumeus]XP_055971009.1 caspase-12-like [Sorex fumeus]
MAGKDDPVDKIKVMTKNFLDGFVDNLVEKAVINRRNLQNMGNTIGNIIKGTQNLFEELKEQSGKGNIVMVIGNPKKQLSLKLVPENEADEFEDGPSSSVTESEDENEKSEDEEKVGSAQALALPSTDPLQHNDALKLCPSAHFHEIKTKKANEIYPVMEKEGRTRLALIIHNKEFEYLDSRDGSEIDLWGMESLLEDLGYSVIIKENLTALEMQEVLEQFAGREEHHTSDSTFLVFMSHGVQKGICGINHKEEEPDILPDENVFQIFNNRNCKNLRNKPKVIITQACRGKGKGIVWVPDQGEVSARRRAEKSLQNNGMTTYIRSDAVTLSHLERDFIAFKSSTLNNVSWRLDSSGSLFISQLIRCFKTYSWCCHLEEVFRKVQHSFETPSDLAQMPTIDRVTLTRYFYLFPGN